MCSRYAYQPPYPLPLPSLSVVFLSFVQTAFPELNVYVSATKQAPVAAATVNQWWVKVSGERLRRLRPDAAAAVVQSAWRGRAARTARVVLADQRVEQRCGSKVREHTTKEKYSVNRRDRAKTTRGRQLVRLPEWTALTASLSRNSDRKTKS